MNAKGVAYVIAAIVLGVFVLANWTRIRRGGRAELSVRAGPGPTHHSRAARRGSDLAGRPRPPCGEPARLGARTTGTAEGSGRCAPAGGAGRGIPHWHSACRHGAGTGRDSRAARSTGCRSVCAARAAFHHPYPRTRPRTATLRHREGCALNSTPPALATTHPAGACAKATFWTISPASARRQHLHSAEPSPSPP